MAKMGTDFHFFGGSSGSLGGEGFSSSWWGGGDLIFQYFYNHSISESNL